MTAALTQRLVQSLTLTDSIQAYVEPFLQLAWPMWRAGGYRAKVVAVRNELTDVYSLVLQPGNRWGGFKAGQYIEITVEKNGRRISRFFSISSSPEYYARTGLIELSIKIQYKGRITPWLANYKNNNNFNNFISISKAQGNFVLSATSQPQLWIAGGSGITPFRSMLQQLALQSKQHNIQLLYYTQTADQVLFEQELVENASALSNVKVHFFNDPQHGYLSKEHLEQTCQDLSKRQIFICGPTPMIGVARQLVNELGAQKTQIHYEYFGAAPIDLPRDFSHSSLITFQRSALTKEVNNEQPKSLLEVAEEAGLTPVSGCRMGVCHQCVCQKKSGTVLNTLTGQYSDTGAGEVQLCVSVACDDLVLEL